VTADIRMALAGRMAPHLSTVIAGLGGRAITKKSLRACWHGRAGELPPLSFSTWTPAWPTGNWPGCVPPPVRAEPGKHAQGLGISASRIG